jgi:hypothetical protein
MYADANQMLSDALCARPQRLQCLPACLPCALPRLTHVWLAANVRTVAAYGLSHDMVGLYTRAQEGTGEQLRKRANINGFAFGFGQGMFVFLCTYI